MKQSLLNMRLTLSALLLCVACVAWGEKKIISWKPSNEFASLTDKVTEFENYNKVLTEVGHPRLEFAFTQKCNDKAKYDKSSGLMQLNVDYELSFKIGEGYVISQIELISSDLSGDYIGLTEKTAEEIGNLSNTQSSVGWNGYANKMVLLVKKKFGFKELKVTYSQAKTQGPLQITSAGYCTYYNEEQYFMPDGCTGYTVSLNGESLIMTPYYSAGSYVPANTPLLIEGDEKTYTLYASYNTPKIYSSARPQRNLLRGDIKTTTHSGGGEYFKFSYDSEEKNLGFYWDVEGGRSITNPANKCYLFIKEADLPAFPSSSIKGFSLSDMVVDDGDASATGVKAVEAVAQPAAGTYNIQGQRVGEDYKGLVIKDGKKYLNR